MHPVFHSCLQHGDEYQRAPQPRTGNDGQRRGIGPPSVGKTPATGLHADARMGMGRRTHSVRGFRAGPSSSGRDCGLAAAAAPAGASSTAGDCCSCAADITSKPASPRMATRPQQQMRCTSEQKTDSMAGRPGRTVLLNLQVMPATVAGMISPSTAAGQSQCREAGRWPATHHSSKQAHTETSQVLQPAAGTGQHPHVDTSHSAVKPP